MPSKTTSVTSKTFKENAGDFEAAASVLREKFGTRSMHTIDTDRRLFALYSKHGSRWRTIANEIGGFQHGFTEDVCRNRVIRVLKKAGIPYKPIVERCAPRKPKVQCKWTKSEDELLMRLVGQADNFEWDEIQRHFPKRTKQALRNRAQRVIRFVKECRMKNVPIEQGIGGREMQVPKRKKKKKVATETMETGDANDTDDTSEAVTLVEPEVCETFQHCPEFDDFLPHVTYSPSEIQQCQLYLPDRLE